MRLLCSVETHTSPCPAVIVGWSVLLVRPTPARLGAVPARPGPARTVCRFWKVTPPSVEIATTEERFAFDR